MKEERYLIKEAAAMVGVEAHVLRYWEEELGMDIHRNKMGHRYYTPRDIELLKKIHNLKESGFQLKAIRNCIEKRKEQMDNEKQNKEVAVIGETTEENGVETGKMESSQKVISFAEKSRSVTGEVAATSQMPRVTEEQNLVPVKQQILSNEAKMEQFQQLMNRIVSNAIKENNELIGKSVGEHTANAVVNQLSGMTKEQEAKAEERYRKLDQTLREIQKARQEAGMAKMRPVDKRRQARLNRKSKQNAGFVKNESVALATSFDEKESESIPMAEVAATEEV